MALPPYAGPLERSWYYGFRIICALILFFLIFPILVIIPLSFNSLPFFTFTPEMLRLDPAGYSLVNYKDFFTSPVAAVNGKAVRAQIGFQGCGAFRVLPAEV